MQNERTNRIHVLAAIKTAEFVGETGDFGRRIPPALPLTLPAPVLFSTVFAFEGLSVAAAPPGVFEAPEGSSTNVACASAFDQTERCHSVLPDGGVDGLFPPLSTPLPAVAVAQSLSAPPPTVVAVVFACLTS